MTRTLQLSWPTPADRWDEAVPLGNGRIGAMAFGGAVRAVRAQRRHRVVGNARRPGPGTARCDRGGAGPARLAEVRAALDAGDVRTAEAPADGVRGPVLAGVPAARRPRAADRECLGRRLPPRARPRRGRADRDAACARRHGAPALVGVGARPGAARRAHRGRRVRSIHRAHDAPARRCRRGRARGARDDARHHGAHRRRAAARVFGGTAAAVRRVRHRLRRLRGRRRRAGHRRFRGLRALQGPPSTGPAGCWSPSPHRPAPRLWWADEDAELADRLPRGDPGPRHRAADAAARRAPVRAARRARRRRRRPSLGRGSRSAADGKARGTSTATSSTATDEQLKATVAAEFGAYLLASSSRPGGPPANLQGIWNDQLRPPWSSNYTININTR